MYEDQNQIDTKRVDMATALVVRSGLDPDKIVRTMGGGYVGANRNVKAFLKSAESVVSKEDYLHIKRILSTGCPSRLQLEEPQANKL